MFDKADQSTPGHYGPSQTALLLLDFHSILVNQFAGPNGVAAMKTAAEMRTWAKSKGIKVIHCLIDIHGTPFPTCKDAERFAGVAKMMQADDAGEEPRELLEGGDDDFTFSRVPGYVSALKSPGLEDFLQKNGIKSLILTGLSTSGCVTKTALAANDAEYVVSVLSDGCADRDQDVHDTMVGKILNNRGYVTTASEFREGFTKASGQ